jgi:hypothetical protein
MDNLITLKENKQKALDLANYIEVLIVQETERLEFVKRLESLDKELR